MSAERARRSQSRFQATLGTVVQAEPAAVPFRYALCYGQSETNAARFPAARAFRAVKGFEYLFEFRLRNPGPFVLDSNFQAGVVVIDDRSGGFSVLDGVFEQIGEAAFQGLRPPRERHARIALDPDLAATSVPVLLVGPYAQKRRAGMYRWFDCPVRFTLR